MQSLVPSEYFPGIKFNYNFYTTGDTRSSDKIPTCRFARSSRHPYSRLFDSPPSFWHLYVHGTFASHGFHGESLDCGHGAGLLGTRVDCYLRPPFMSEITSVTLTWNQSVCGVMGHTPSLCPPSDFTVMSRDFRCTWVRRDSCTPEWPKFGPTTIPNFCLLLNR